MNIWMSDPFPYPEKPITRGKVLDEAKLAELGSFGRYRDVDGDAIAYRTIPGDGLPAYFNRGSGHDADGRYSERPDDYVKNLDRLARKLETAKTMVPAPEVHEEPGAAVGIIAYGTSHWAVVESRDQLAREAGVKTAYLRLRAYPFTAEVEAFIGRHDRVYVVEQNRDAQMRALLKMDLAPELAVKLRSVRHYDGLPIDARSITDDVLGQEG
jgi:2-oxoglutarate ferredoxin oxidoreductase subunit alpha